MADYPTRYLFIAQTRGIKRAADELNALALAMSRVNASGAASTINLAAGRTTVLGGATQFGPGKTATKEWEGLSGYVEKFGIRLRSAFMYSIAFSAVGAVFSGVAASVAAWVDAQVKLNEVVSDTIILLNRTAQEGEWFANTQRALSFATGQSITEISTASMMAERVGQPELATSAAQWSMVIGPALQASETVDDLRALSIQFDLSMEQINNGILATLQNSGIAADQLFELSSSFGVFAGQLGLGKTEEDLRKIAGLFAALSNVTGQSTPTLQNFVRRMADEFYDPGSELRKRLEEAGIQTVYPGQVTRTIDPFGNIIETSEEVRRSFIEIFTEIAAKGPNAIREFSTAIDNSLGQPTQSQFIQVADFWSEFTEIINNTVSSTAQFSEAVSTAEKKTSTALGQIAAAIRNLASVVGDGAGFNRAMRTIAAAIQNVYDTTRKTNEGVIRIPRGEEFRNALETGKELGLEDLLERVYGDDWGNQIVQRRLYEILRVMETPVVMTPEQRQTYAFNAISQFARSRFVNMGDVGVVGAQQFLAFTRSEDFRLDEALKAAFAGSLTDIQIAQAFSNMLSEAQMAALGFRTVSEVGAGLRQVFIEMTQGGAEAAAVFGPLAGGARYAEGELVNLAGAAGDAVMTFQSLKQLRLPEGYSLADLDPNNPNSFYSQAGRIIASFNQGNLVTPFDRGKRGPMAVTDEFGIPIATPNLAEQQAMLALSLMQRDKTMLSRQEAYQNKSLASQEAYQNKMLGAWNGMINDILKPSAVTGTDLFYNSPRGAYNDNWDEPVRRMRADINNALAGRPLEYNWGGLGQYMNMDAIMAAMGMDAESMSAILRSEEQSVADRFYNMELPWEAYSGYTDAIIANARAWIAGRRQKNANMANIQQLLVDAGLGPDAAEFVSAMEEPPILRQLFGGKSANEISAAVTSAVTPDLGEAIGKQVTNVTWAMTISTAIENDVANNYEMIVAAGRAIGRPLAEGSAQAIATAIIPLVIAAIVNSSGTP